MKTQSPEETWKRFYIDHKKDAECFITLFQFIQIKTYSEAICETVGSIMNIHRGRGRNLHPVNYHKELFLRFNLPPLHHLTTTFIPALVKIKLEENTKYYRKLDHSRLDKLKFQTLSATIGNFRKREEERSHLPLSYTEP